MKTYNEIVNTKTPFDASGIDNPNNYLWVQSGINTNVYYPIAMIVTSLELTANVDGIHSYEVRCISSINEDTETTDYHFYYCTYDPQHHDWNCGFEWLWNGREDEVSPYWEEVEDYIAKDYLTRLEELDYEKASDQPHTHLKDMVALVEELQDTELIHLEEDMPQEYSKFVLAKQYVAKFLAIILVALTLVGCQRDVPTEMTDAEWQTLEVINSLEDAKEFMISDIEEGRIDSERAYTYLLIIDESIDNLTNLPKTK